MVRRDARSTDVTDVTRSERSALMSDDDGWGTVAPPPAGDIIKDALKKEQLLKSVVPQLHGLDLTRIWQRDRGLAAGSSQLVQVHPVNSNLIVNPTAILARVQSVQKEVDKLTSGNETLQMYIDNLTVQMAKSRR